jgi:outer membrane protein assembly factor BamB
VCAVPVWIEKHRLEVPKARSGFGRRARAVLVALFFSVGFLLLAADFSFAEWPTVRGNSLRTGFARERIAPPFRLRWAVGFQNERLSTCVEPIVAAERVYVGTHSGNLYCLDAQTGSALWRFKCSGAFLHSPAVESGVVVAASSDGYVYGLDAATGKLLWHSFGGRGGFSASLAVSGGAVLIGSRAGIFLALNAKTGKPLWRRQLGAPIRQTAASDGKRVFVTAEDMAVRCFDVRTGSLVWTSARLVGQTAKDYYPVLAKVGNREVVVVRTNPVLKFSDRLNRDRRMLCNSAGVDDSSWQSIDAWIKSPSAAGTPELWQKEQKAILGYLERNRDTRTFFVLDARTGAQLPHPPVLWAAGCQGVGAPPVVLPDGRLLVFHRSVYGNWNLGVAPFISIGILDLASNSIQPLRHVHGSEPPWDTFWGTADESQNLVGTPGQVLVVHQATLSLFDLESGKLSTVWGTRDTFGGFRDLPWAKNEWHGPARGGAAVSGGRIYWITGSRVLCVETGSGASAGERMIRASDVPAKSQSAARSLTSKEASVLLARAVEEALSKQWAPLVVEPGLAGRQRLFTNSGELFEALSLAYPFLPIQLRVKVEAFLGVQWFRHPPFSRACWYPDGVGARREYWWVPGVLPLPEQTERPYHEFGNMYALWLYAERCSAWPRVLSAYGDLKRVFQEFRRSGWELDGSKGDLYANRYIASLIAFEKIAARAGDAATASEAASEAKKARSQLAFWWRRSASNAELRQFGGVAELDKFIGAGDGLFFRVEPHNSKVALFRDLTPEVASWVRADAPEAVKKVCGVFQALCPTWHLMGEERQVHYGENYVDPPDFALGAFKAKAWLENTRLPKLLDFVDIPFCKGDLTYVEKLAIALESGRPSQMQLASSKQLRD